MKAFCKTADSIVVVCTIAESFHLALCTTHWSWKYCL